MPIGHSLVLSPQQQSHTHHRDASLMSDIIWCHHHSENLVLHTRLLARSALPRHSHSSLPPHLLSPRPFPTLMGYSAVHLHEDARGRTRSDIGRFSVLLSASVFQKDCGKKGGWTQGVSHFSTPSDESACLQRSRQSSSENGKRGREGEGLPC